jgi:uncharacterized protein
MGMRIRNERDGSLLADNVEVARSLARRLVGLIGRRELPSGSALVIPKCRQVHTFFMRFPIDVVFVDAQNRILSVAANVKPYSITQYCKGAVNAIELPARTASEYRLKPGDKFLMSEE